MRNAAGVQYYHKQRQCGEAQETTIQNIEKSKSDACKVWLRWKDVILPWVYQRADESYCTHAIFRAKVHAQLREGSWPISTNATWGMKDPSTLELSHPAPDSEIVINLHHWQFAQCTHKPADTHMYTHTLTHTCTHKHTGTQTPRHACARAHVLTVLTHTCMRHKQQKQSGILRCALPCLSAALHAGKQWDLPT